MLWRILFFIKMKETLRFILLCTLLLSALPTLGASDSAQTTCPLVRIVPERLPDMTMPRSGHSVFYANGELTVTGGHTTNFVTTPTAEYYADGQWHQMTMAYTHDNGFAVVLRSGEVIIGGGHDEPLGIGQTFMVERYTPATHSFEGFGCLDRRRVLAKATQLADGRVIISGNHYAKDAIGCYDGRSQVEHVKDVVQGRSNPYILRTTADDAIIAGGNDVYDQHPDTVWADRVKGDAFRVPLLEQWYLVYIDLPFSSDACSIGDQTYLLTATDKSGQLGIIEVCDTVFSLLPTVCPIPMEGPFGPVFYKGPIVIDRNRLRGYILGVDSLYHRQYLLAVDYAQKPAALTLYYTDSLEQANITIPVVTPGGDIILAGGNPNNNYKPLSTVWLYHFGTTPKSASRSTLYFTLLTALAVVALFTYIIIYKRRRRKRSIDNIPPPTDQATKQTSDQATANLMERICRLMDEEQLYLRSDLRLQDVAVHLSTNSSYVSECINNVSNQSFSQFVNTYRVRHAQELLRQQPDMKTATIATNSGFSTETSFFRNFKTVTGMTPREWVASVKREQNLS